MAKYRKKPIEIEAFQYCPRPGVTWGDVPSWFMDALRRKAVRPAQGCIMITTLEGQIAAVPGDWIVKNGKGALSICKPAAFAETYEAMP